MEQEMWNLADHILIDLFVFFTISHVDTMLNFDGDVDANVSFRKRKV